MWAIKLPLKIRIFLWQWIKSRVPSGVEVLKRNGPGDGICPLCDMMEDSNHIFFTCVTAQFLWNCFRDAVDGRWCHTNVPDLFVEIQSTPSSARHIRWLTIRVLTWTLWTVRNKLVIQRVPASATGVTMGEKPLPACGATTSTAHSRRFPCWWRCLHLLHVV